MGVRARLRAWSARPLGRAGWLGLAVLIGLGPAWLFADLLAYPLVFNDDWAFVAASRTLPRAWENLFRPLNVHVVPAWRLLAWGVVAASGRLSNLPEGLEAAAFGTLLGLMLVGGRFVARETGRAEVGAAAAAALGASALVAPSATWFSAGQTLGAGLGVVATLGFLQGWRRAGGAGRLALAALAAVAAGGCWTVGHAAGPVGAVYLWADGRARCRRAAAVPLAASALAVVAAWWTAGREVERLSAVTFQGRSVAEAVHPVRGAAHALQAVPERLALGELGLTGEVTLGQAGVFALGLAAAWLVTRRRGLPPTPLECAGAALVVIAYGMEWAPRGYLPYYRTRGMVPWYETVPHVGAVLFASGWWAAVRPSAAPLTRAGAVRVLVLEAALLLAHQPRVDAQFLRGTPLTPSEAAQFPTPALRRLRAVYLSAERAGRHRRHLVRLERAEALARRLGVGRDALGRAAGTVVWPLPPRVLDTALLDLPRGGDEIDPARLRRALGEGLAPEPDPRPPWLARDEAWPPRP